MFRYPGQWNLVWGVITPSCSAASVMMILKLLPGEYCPWITRFMSGVSGSLLTSFQAAGSIPLANSLGS